MCAQTRLWRHIWQSSHRSTRTRQSRKIVMIQILQLDSDGQNQVIYFLTTVRFIVRGGRKGRAKVSHRKCFLRCGGSRLTLLSMMTDINSHFRVPRRHKAVQVVRKYSTASLVSSGSHWVRTRACIPFNFVWVAFSVVFNSIPEWLSAPTELISSDAIGWPWKSCGLHVDSHDAVRWLTMKIFRYRCSRFFAILFAKNSIHNLSDNFRNQIRGKENNFPKPTE